MMVTLLKVLMAFKSTLRMQEPHKPEPMRKRWMETTGLD